MSICEVRVPTYKRPDLLKRSLRSLIGQTYESWRAIVLDDSPAQEAKAVIETLNDDRIIYKPHPANLGRAKNIDYAFQSSSYIDGEYAFVLEDDNYLFPEFIAENIKSIEENKANILLRNQEVRLEKNGESIYQNKTTRGKCFQQGVYNPFELRARLFFCEGITNGGLFWNTQKIKSNLQVGPKVENSWHQELFRSFKIEEPIYFESKPLCVFTEFERKENKLYFMPQCNRATQSILTYIVKIYGHEIIEEADKIAQDKEAKKLLECNLINMLYFNYKFKQISQLEKIKLMTKYYLRYLFSQDPFKGMLIHKT